MGWVKLLLNLVGCAEDVHNRLKCKPFRDVVSTAEHLAELGSRQRLLRLQGARKQTFWGQRFRILERTDEGKSLTKGD